MKKTIFGLSTVFALASGSQAAVLVDDFESYNNLFDSMNGKGGWVVSGNSASGFVDDYLGGVRSATVGYVPTAGQVILSHALNLEMMSGPSYVATSLSFDFNVNDPSVGARSAFQFYFKTDAAGSGNLLTIDLTPGAAGEYDVTQSSGYYAPFAFNSFINTYTNTDIKLDIYNDGGNVGFTVSSVGSELFSGQFGGVLATNKITEFGVVRLAGDGTSDGFLTIDNVYMVPEPSSALLLGLAGLGLMLRRRRA